MKEPSFQQNRYFLKDTVRRTIDFSQTDQSRGVRPPPVEKPFPADARRIDLARPGQWENIAPLDLQSAIGNRESRRRFTGEPLTLEEVSFLLWTVQGMRQMLDSGSALRTVPSAGCRHALETYLCAGNVAGLEPAFYRYLP
ncbi:MAG: SagB/ThcOx family dehydrogenase, partial [Planctomycetes bacterium]|nr:SagB/ThcOx family dehydrogenase [Planctomycetota bacterium]